MPQVLCGTGQDGTPFFSVCSQPVKLEGDWLLLTVTTKEAAQLAESEDLPALEPLIATKRAAAKKAGK